VIVIKFTIFVTGKKTGNIVVISPDGNSAKEVYQISVPRAMCYDKNENKILVCHTQMAHIFSQAIFSEVLQNT
jgi:hypothetical protein